MDKEGTSIPKSTCIGISFALLLLVLTTAIEFGNPLDIKVIKKSLLLISLDGFHPDYLNYGQTPTLASLGKRGIRAEFMQTTYPSVTFPNHYSIVTGLHAESHGIVGNTFYDPRARRNFSYSSARDNSDPFWWNSGEPIYTSAESQGFTAASMMWPGSQCELKGVIPTHLQPFTRDISITQKMDMIADWYKSSNSPALTVAYFSEIDSGGHSSGRNGTLLKQALIDVDNAVKHLLFLLSYRLALTDIIIVSDHGMSDVDPKNVIYLDDLKMESWRYTLVNNYAFVLVYPNTDQDNSILLVQLAKISKRMPELQVNHLPDRYYYHHLRNPRIPSIVLTAPVGWIFTSRGYAPSKGNHGYDPMSPDSHAIFLAAGPSFQKGKIIHGFANVELYSLFCSILGIKEAPNNGTGYFKKLLA